MKTEIPIRWYKCIDSTNSEARRHMDDNDKMSVYAAEYQTAGRGQRGNKWSSASGENLTFSILVHPEPGNRLFSDIHNQFLFSIISALSITDFLSGKGVDATIKWPNDIYVRDKKICGMLIENTISNQAISSSIIGIGLNLNQSEFPAELMNPTSLFLVTRKSVELKGALEEIIGLFLKRYEKLSCESKPEGIINEFESKMYRKGQCHQYRDCLTEETFTGIIKGISEEGMLLMEMPDKSIRKFAFKELGYIL